MEEASTEQGDIPKILHKLIDDSTETQFLRVKPTGGPGSGKGTQCAKIAETFGFLHLSAGELLRKEILSGRENGSLILDIIKEGKIVPSEITVNLILREIELTENRKVLIDGFPRTDENRIAFERILLDQGHYPFEASHAETFHLYGNY
ncbi:hypothetical protein KSP40_PGU008106 [Platanthera guangdongensis]|uniref:adenylate kinase n=1 Tax=Platanthera guangdongensis TaxID=2320717 RepID=A0ABR2LPX4_9ASPA